jgi:acyl-CoA reductase-like NAD-dependent aldehyde dehydrogenase
MTMRTLLLARRMVRLEAAAHAARAHGDTERAEALWKLREETRARRSALMRIEQSENAQPVRYDR